MSEPTTEAGRKMAAYLRAEVAKRVAEIAVNAKRAENALLVEALFLMPTRLLYGVPFIRRADVECVLAIRSGVLESEA